MEPILWDRHQTPSFPYLSGEHKEAVFSRDLEEAEHYYDEVLKEVRPEPGDEYGPHAGVKTTRKRLAQLKELFAKDNDLRLQIDKADREIAEATKRGHDYDVASEELRTLRSFANRVTEARKLALRRPLLALACRSCGYTERRINLYSTESRE